MQNPAEKKQEQAPEVELFGKNVSAEDLESYMNKNFEPVAQASLVALVTTIFI